MLFDVWENQNQPWELEIVGNKSIHSILFPQIISELYIFYLYFNLAILPRQGNIERVLEPTVYIYQDRQLIDLFKKAVVKLEKEIYEYSRNFNT